MQDYATMNAAAALPCGSMSMPAHWEGTMSANSVKLIGLALPGTEGTLKLPSSIDPQAFLNIVWKVKLDIHCCEAGNNGS